MTLLHFSLFNSVAFDNFDKYHGTESCRNGCFQEFNCTTMVYGLIIIKRKNPFDI